MFLRFTTDPKRIINPQNMTYYHKICSINDTMEKAICDSQLQNFREIKDIFNRRGREGDAFCHQNGTEVIRGVPWERPPAFHPDVAA